MIEAPEKLTIFIPIFDYVAFDKMDHPPTADQVAVIIVEAARMTGANPQDVIQGVQSFGGHPEIPRARAYAALVIRALFPDNGSVGLGRMVGASHPKSFVSSFDYALRKGGVPWWSDADFMSLVDVCEKRLGIKDDARTEVVA